MRLKVSLFLFFFGLVSFRSLAQHSLQLQALVPGEQQMLDRLPYQSEQLSKETARQELKKIVSLLHRQGYLLAHAKSVQVAADTSRAILVVGQPVSWALLEKGNVEQAWLNNTLFREKSFRGRPFRYPQLAQLMGQLLSEAENRGHPFAAVWLDSLQLNSGKLHARLHMDKGPLIIFDTLEVRGNARLSAKYLSALLDIKPGEPYNQQRLEAAAGRLRQLSFVRLEEAPVVSFQNKQATVKVGLAEKRANRLDGIVGLLPDPQQAGRFLFTGQFDLLLQNPFGTGKRIALQWQRLSPGSQNLEAGYRHPYLFGTPLGLAVGFGLLKEADAFVNRQFMAEARLQQGPYNTLRLRMEQKDSRLLAAAAAGMHAGFRLEQYGIGFDRQQLNDPFLPRQGYEFNLNLSGGKKKVRTLPQQGDSVQAQLPLGSMQYRASVTFRYFWPLGRRWVWAHALDGGLLSDEHLFQNDLYRLGGLASLRGFREKNFFVSDYVLSRWELRYLAGSETYFFLFYDQAWMAQRAGNLHVKDWPLGLGSGLSLRTTSGTFNFVYGMGKSDTQSLKLSGSQVHFGYLNQF